MKKLRVLALCIMFAMSLVPVMAETTDGAGSHNDGGKIIVLATGGTIAGVGEAGKTAGYIPGALTAEELLLAVPQLARSRADRSKPDLQRQLGRYHG